MPLCRDWWENRDEMSHPKPIKEEELPTQPVEVSETFYERPVIASPPPPRCPTMWVVAPSTPEEKEVFREQVLFCFIGSFLLLQIFCTY